MNTTIAETVPTLLSDGNDEGFNDLIGAGVADLQCINKDLVDKIIASQLMGFVGPGSSDNKMIQKSRLQHVVAVAFSTGLAAGRGAK